jgi:two-component system phosphate regulon sensor histidine kinase PhoR
VPRKISGILTEALLEMLSDPVIAIDKEGKVHIYNDAAAQVFGVPLGRVVGSRVWDALPMNDFCKALIAMVKESRPSFREGTYSFPDGRLFIGQLLPVRNEEGRLAGAVATLKDLTHLHRIEQHVTDFVGNVSNELRLPLTSIKGFIETLLEGAMSDPTVTRKFLQVINDETNRMVKLIMGLNEATTAPPRPTTAAPVDLPAIVHRAAGRLAPFSEQKGVKVSVDVVGACPFIMADADKLEQVITNLLDNAIKFTGIKGGEGRVRLVVKTEGGSVTVKVEDNGIGIPASDLERIFERYYRVQEGPAAQLGGTGLGLFISRELLRQFGSHLVAQSTLGQGSVFTFSLSSQA